MRDEITRLADNNSRWVTQDKFYDPSQPPEVCTGNCTEAALASILGIRLDQVPSFQGLVSEDYWDAVYEFVNSRGFDLVMNHRATHYPGLYLADGPSPRGCGHFVVMHDGEMIHDPHPSRAGLLSIEKTWALIPHDPASLASKTDHTEDKLGMVPEDRSKWSLHDRVEFALRDAGFDYDEAFNIASIAAAPAPDHSAGVGGMVAKVSAPDGWEFTEGGGVTEVFDIAQWPDIGGIWRDDETGLPVLHAEGDLKDWPSGKINAVLVQVNRAQPADADAEGAK